MSRSKSSQKWLQEHHDDPYVLKARREGYRSRAVYKLIELQQKDKLLKPGMFVLDLGAAPSGWSEYVSHFSGPKGRLIAIDILPVDPIAGVEIVQGDFTEANTLKQEAMEFETKAKNAYDHSQDLHWNKTKNDTFIDARFNETVKKFNMKPYPKTIKYSSVIWIITESLIL